MSEKIETVWIKKEQTQYENINKIKIEEVKLKSESTESNNDYVLFNTNENNTKTSIKTEGITQCDECQEEFLDEAYLTVHKYIHDPNKTCGICKKKFKVDSAFFRHVNNHLTLVLKCEFCSQIFVNKTQLTVHVSGYHTNKQFVCDTCQKGFNTKKELIRHFPVHSSDKQYKCEICSKSYKLSNSLLRHKKLHKQDRIKQLTCDVCNTVYATTSSLKKHVKNRHEKINETGIWHPCKIGECPDSFPNTDELKIHKMNKHPESLYFCKFQGCDKPFSTRSNLIKHLRKKHGESRQFKCKLQDCQEYFFSRPALNAHKIKQHPDTVDTFICQHCHMTFTNRWNYVKHRRAHNSYLEGFNCSLCGEYIEGFKNYRDHNMTHLLMTPEEYSECEKTNKFTCKLCNSFKPSGFQKIKKHLEQHVEKNSKCHLCNAVFTYPGLRRHIILKHKEIECLTCNQIFNGQVKFNNHRQDVHLQETLENSVCKCKFCKKSFKNKYKLNGHLRQHGVTRYFKCTMCNKKSVSIKEFKQHLSLFHENYNKQKLILNEVYVKLPTKLRNVRGKYRCRVCKQTFALKGLLMSHLRVHGSNKALECQLCKMVFYRRDRLERHLKNKMCKKRLSVVLKDEVATRDIGKCKICDKQYVDEYGLKVHMKSHDASYKYPVCKFCDIKFTQMGSWRKHTLRYHPGVDAYKCRKCFKGFTRLGDYRKHDKLEHSKKYALKIAKRESMEEKIEEDLNTDGECKVNILESVLPGDTKKE